MMEISLPVLPGETPLRSAMAVLHGMQLSALVTLRQGEAILVRAGAIVHSANSGGSAVADVAGEAISMDVVQLDNATSWVTTHNVREVPRDRNLAPDEAAYAQLFATKSNNFALSSLSPGRALVVCRYETIGFPIQFSPSDYYCSVNPDDPIDSGPPRRCVVDRTHPVESM